ncbi:MAG TPA: ABC transporter permease [Dongiaceae bacterium]|nr:ABC transporter permease [Dongiaceae bacterium]
MNKIAVVAQREFLSTVKRRSYLIVTFGMPFFVSLYLGLVAVVPALFMAQSGAQRKESALVDESGIVRAEEMANLEDDDAEKEISELAKKFTGTPTSQAAAKMIEESARPSRLRLFEKKDAALQALVARDVDRVYVVPADYTQKGGIETYQRLDASFNVGRSRGRESLEKLLERSLIADRIPLEMRPLVEKPISQSASRSFTVADDGAVAALDSVARIARVAIPGVFAILFFMSVMVSAGYLLQGVSEEKENRVIEVILSSVRPDQLLFGKLLGLGAAGLLQLVVWIAVATMATSLLAAAALAVLDFKLFFGCLLFFVLGFLMLGSLMTGTAALGTTAREGQQMATIWSTLTIMPPAFTWMGVLDAPNGALARALGWFPLTAPITMMLRLGTGQVPWWDVMVAAGSLVVGVYLAIRVAGALFRLGLLMYGKRPSLKEIFRQLRHA